MARIFSGLLVVSSAKSCMAATGPWLNLIHHSMITLLHATSRPPLAFPGSCNELFLSLKVLETPVRCLEGSALHGRQPTTFTNSQDSLNIYPYITEDEIPLSSKSFPYLLHVILRDCVCRDLTMIRTDSYINIYFPITTHAPGDRHAIFL